MTKDFISDDKLPMKYLIENIVVRINIEEDFADAIGY